MGTIVPQWVLHICREHDPWLEEQKKRLPRVLLEVLVVVRLTFFFSQFYPMGTTDKVQRIIPVFLKQRRLFLCFHEFPPRTLLAEIITGQNFCGCGTCPAHLSQYQGWVELSCGFLRVALMYGKGG